MHNSIFRRLEQRFGDSPECSRRDWLRAALTGGVGLALAGPPFGAAALANEGAKSRSASGRKVLVLGAGFAGLSAALELQAAGCDVTVVEARHRLGGRVRTLSNLIPGKTVEAGGELIGLNQPTWLAFAKRYALELKELLEYPLDQSPILLEGRRLSADQAEALWQEMQESLRGLCNPATDIDAYAPWTDPNAAILDARSTADWIASLKVSRLCRLALTIQLTSINGMHPAWQSFLGNLAMVKGGGLEDYWTKTDSLVCKGGNQQLAERMADELGRHRIRFGTPVAGIKTNDDCIATVRLADGTELEGDEVVVAVPASCYGRIAFDPPLPAALVPQMGTNCKYLVALSRAAWEPLKLAPRVLTDGPIAMAWHSTSTQPGGTGEVLTLYAGGATADQAQELSDANRTEGYLSALDKLYPGIRDAVLGGRFVDWQNDRHARGSYSFPAPGQVTSIGPLLEKNIGPMYFAGEHCCPAFIGYMEGALQSGIRTAKRVLGKP